MEHSFAPSFPPPPHPTSLQNPNPNVSIPSSTTSDLSTAISQLKTLIDFVDSTLQSVSGLFSISSTTNPTLLRCPHDSRHRLPPESIFRHSLRCLSAAAIPDLSSLLSSLRYPTTLQSDSHFGRDASFTLALPDPDADLCFSIDEKCDGLGSNFFYKDCPGVVTFPESDGSSRTFTLPGFLAAECSNFVGGDRGVDGLGIGGILPSEFWALKCEVAAWVNCPRSYSYSVLRVASSLDTKECGALEKWVISNSWNYGVLVDSHLRDHLVLLLKVCLKAIRREAFCSLKLSLSKDGFSDPNYSTFECPRLVGSLNWLASQLAVLYGEINANIFAVNMVKESLLLAGSNLMLFKSGKDDAGEDHAAKSEDAVDRDTGCGLLMLESVGNLESRICSTEESKGQVFVSQVAAAVAAMHERSLLEERIKALRFAHSVPKSHIFAEHSYVLTRSSEERRKRLNYRAVIEHDGLFGHNIGNQDSSKTKTREELLAEERDYKRRRMSYRGKKVKRTPSQVIHDIIEDHMEEIKKAGGIGCHVKVTGDAVMPPSEASSQIYISRNINEEISRTDNELEKYMDSPVHRKSQQVEHNITSRRGRDVPRSDSPITRYDLQKSRHKIDHEHSEYLEDYKKHKHERGTNYGSRNSPSRSDHSHLRRRHALREKHNNWKEGSCEGSDSDFSSRYYSSRSTLTSKSSREVRKRGDDYTSETRSISSGRFSERHRSVSVTQDAFDDRYDPSGSYDGRA